MKYALLIYSTIADRDSTSEADRARINASVAEVLERPQVTGWLRLGAVETATTLRSAAGKSLLTDGPFTESKEFLGGFVVVEADNLDGALAVADELQAIRAGGAIEVRPVREGNPRDD